VFVQTGGVLAVSKGRARYCHLPCNVVVSSPPAAASHNLRSNRKSHKQISKLNICILKLRLATPACSAPRPHAADAAEGTRRGYADRQPRPRATDAAGDTRRGYAGRHPRSRAAGAAAGGSHPPAGPHAASCLVGGTQTPG
jgi:hypothetical protein